MPARPAAPSGATLRIATRGSPLARWQAQRVGELIAGLPGGPGFELVVVRTRGDEQADVPVARIGGQGAFVKEVQSAVLDGRADMAVHSAKDLPSATPEGLELACIPERADPRDALVGSALGDLAPGATVATGSVRRQAQLAWIRPDLTFCELRGNMATRVERAEATGAGVVALAALERLGLEAHVADVLDVDTMVPQVAQGAIGVECRRADDRVREVLRSIDDHHAHDSVTAERAFLAALGGGCTLPLGALCTRTGRDGDLALDGMLASRDGHVLLRRRAVGRDPVELGARVATQLLDECGGRALEDWSGPGAPGGDA